MLIAEAHLTGFATKSESLCYFFYFSGDSGLTIVRRLSGKKSQQQSEPSDNQLEQYIYSDSQPTSVNSGFCSLLENRLKMQPTSLNDDLESIDLTTESLPAVDTPDACDKAALRCVIVLAIFIVLKSWLPIPSWSVTKASSMPSKIPWN